MIQGLTINVNVLTQNSYTSQHFVLKNVNHVLGQNVNHVTLDKMLHPTKKAETKTNRFCLLKLLSLRVRLICNTFF